MISEQSVTKKLDQYRGIDLNKYLTDIPEYTTGRLRL